MGASPYNGSSRQLDDGVTPISKNTRVNKERSAFNFEKPKKEEDMFSSNSTNLIDFTPLPHINIGKGDSSQQSTSSSPALSLDIKDQLSWNIDQDISKDSFSETPVSFGSNISPTFWNGKSPTEKVFGGMESPIDDDVMGGTSSPIPIFFNSQGPDSKKNIDSNNNRNSSMPHPQPQPQAQQAQSQPVRESIPHHTPSTPMPEPPSYYHRTSTPHSSMRPTSGHHPQNPPPNYQSPRPFYHRPNDQRIVNLRGRAPAPTSRSAPHMQHLPPHLPNHSHHFLTSPIGAPSRNMMMNTPPHHGMPPSPFSQSPHLTVSKRRCIPLKHPLPTKFQGDMEKLKNAPIPEFTNLVNFPSHMSQKQAVNLPDGMRCCVMCGAACRCSSTKSKKGSKKDDMGRKGGMNGNYAIIPTQNKGLCTQCDVNVWVVTQSQLEIKWCKGCKNFRPWAAFGEKGLATKCVRCRDRQREKYAAQKEEKDKKKAMRARGK